MRKYKARNANEHSTVGVISRRVEFIKPPNLPRLRKKNNVLSSAHEIATAGFVMMPIESSKAIVASGCSPGSDSCLAENHSMA